MNQWNSSSGGQGAQTISKLEV